MYCSIIWLMKNKNSPVHKINYAGINLFVKRDDLLDKEFSGNKARKFYYYLHHDFNGIDKIISFGSAQANSLYSLSVLAKLKNVKLDFYTYTLSSFLKQNPCGNYEAALQNGANIIELDYGVNKQEYIEQKVLPNSPKTIFIEEGGRVQEAQIGIKLLAQEIMAWAQEQHLADIKVILPSGTGTTALFLQKFLPFEVLTVPCVGDEKYLKAQFIKLNANEKEHPTMITVDKKYHFGKLYKAFYEEYQSLLHQTGIEFDLLYDPLGFMALKKYLQEVKPNNTAIVYIHQGGILGNASMIERYKRKLNQTK